MADYCDVYKTRLANLIALIPQADKHNTYTSTDITWVLFINKLFFKTHFVVKYFCHGMKKIYELQNFLKNLLGFFQTQYLVLVLQCIRFKDQVIFKIFKFLQSIILTGVNYENIYVTVVDISVKENGVNVQQSDHRMQS